MSRQQKLEELEAHPYFGGLFGTRVLPIDRGDRKSVLDPAARRLLRNFELEARLLPKQFTFQLLSRRNTGRL